MTCRRTVALAACALAAALPSGAGARERHLTPAQRRQAIQKALLHSRSLWATINICDTTGHPNAIGIRGSMPGTGERGTMYMRFRVEYYNPKDATWHPVVPGGQSGWMRVGSSMPRARQGGRTFVYTAPPPGIAFTLRGVVDYRWNVAGHVRYRATKHTVHGHTDAFGGDPDGYSAGLCELAAP